MSGPVTRVPSVLPHPPVFTGAGMTHAGRVRDRNEDSILTDPAGVLWAVADGMGGHGHGDVASEIVIDCLSTLDDSVPAADELRRGLIRANSRIARVSAEHGWHSIGATVVAMMIQNSMAVIAWAGDCRAYLLRHGHLRLLTRDHTVVQDMVDQGILQENERDRHPQSHVVTRAVGAEADMQPDVTSTPLVPGDRILLCSDGLTGCLGDHDVTAHMQAAANPRALCLALVTHALENGAPDNVSVIGVFAEMG